MIVKQKAEAKKKAEQVEKDKKESMESKLKKE